MRGGDTTSATGVGIVYFVIAALYAVSVVCTALIHYLGAPAERGHTTLFADVAEGFSYMRSERMILGLLIMGFLPMTFGFTASFLMPAFNQDVIAGGPETLGVMMTTMGVGALCGSLVLARIGDTGGKGRIMFVMAYLWAITLAGFALSETLWAAMLFGAFTGLCGAVFGSMNMSIVQLAIRPEIRGRVMAILMMAHGLMPLGVLPVSAAAEFIGIDTALMLSAVLLGLSMFVLGRVFPDLRHIDRGHGPEGVGR